MKKLLLIAVTVSTFFLMAGIASAASSTINGWVTDSQCGAKGASADHAACLQKCLAKGAKLVVVSDADKSVLTIDNPEMLKGHEGHHMAVTGTVTGSSIHVENMKMM